eukprot:356106-Chlamydomonas_euryale.AAC.2
MQSQRGVERGEARSSAQRIGQQRAPPGPQLHERQRRRAAHLEPSVERPHADELHGGQQGRRWHLGYGSKAQVEEVKIGKAEVEEVKVGEAEAQVEEVKAGEAEVEEVKVGEPEAQETVAIRLLRRGGGREGGATRD